MKKLIILLVFSSLYSCSIESDTYPDLVPEGTWKLVRTHGQVPNSERMGAQMEIQETYELDEDGTFLKERVQEGIICKDQKLIYLRECRRLSGT